MQMKSRIASSLERLAVAGLLGVFAAASSAHGGHSVPSGVSSQQHVHLFDQIVVSPAWLLVVGSAAIALTALVVKRRRARARTH